VPPRKAAPATGYALCVPGLEDIACAELTSAGAIVTDVLARFDRRESIIVFHSGDMAGALRCATLEDVFAVLLDLPTPSGSRAPGRIGSALERRLFERALAAHNALDPKRRGRSYKVVARVAGRHAFRRGELELAIGRAVGAILPRWTHAAGPAAIEIWVHVIGARTIAGLRLSGDKMAGRAWKRAHLPGSLKPTIARALVLMTEPRAGDVFLDPMAGAGTLLRERADAGSARRLLGGDADPDALSATRRNAGSRVALVLWDATRLPLRTGSVDAIAVNPPYGRRHEAVAGLDRLYAHFLREAARVLKPAGRCVVLTGEAAALAHAMPPALRLRSTRRLLLRRLPVTAFVTVRL